MHLDYMKAWIRLNSCSNPADWTAEEVIYSFWLLPLPAVGYDQWHSMVCADEPVAYDPLAKLQTVDKHLIDNGVVEVGAA